MSAADQAKGLERNLWPLSISVTLFLRLSPFFFIPVRMSNDTDRRAVDITTDYAALLSAAKEAERVLRKLQRDLGSIAIVHFMQDSTASRMIQANANIAGTVADTLKPLVQP